MKKENFAQQKFYDSRYKNIYKKNSFKTFKVDKSWYYSWLKCINRNFNLEKWKNKSVFEIGGGIGAFCSLLKDRGFNNILGSDLTDSGIRIARKFNKDIKFTKFNLETDDLDEKFDLIFAFEVLEHLSDINKSVRNIYNLLNLNGVFIGTTPFPFKIAKNLPGHKNVLYPSE